MVIEGIIPALVTPLDERGEFAAAAMDRLLERVYGAGVHGVFVCGSTGEGMLMTPEQRKVVAETVARQSPRGKSVMVHVGSPCMETAVGLARHAEAVGAHGVSSLPPGGMFSFDEVKRYYAVLARTTRLPVYVYHFPAMGGIRMTDEQVLELCAVEGVSGLKCTDMNLNLLWRLAARGVQVLNGYDEVLAAGLLLGAKGGIGSFYNIVPGWFMGLWKAAQAGEWEKAREWQGRINRLIEVVLKYPMAPALKAMLSWEGVECGPSLPPRRALTQEEQEKLRGELEALG